jgi:hypothetical protein
MSQCGEFGGVLALLVGAGCCHCWPWSKDEEPKVPPAFSNTDQPSHLKAERVHGGIE